MATCQALCLYIYSRESFLKYQDVQWIYSVRFCMTKLKMLVRTEPLRGIVQDNPAVIFYS